MKNVFYKYDFHEGNDAQELSQRLKENVPVALQRVAADMATLLDWPCFLVPIPNVYGHTFQTFHLADLLSKFYPDIKVFDIIRGSEKNSVSGGKVRWGRLEDPDFNFVLTAPAPASKRIFLIDNVIDTGLTAASALKLIPSADVLVHSVDRKTFDRSPHRNQFAGVYLCNGNLTVLKNTLTEKNRTSPAQKPRPTAAKRKPKK